MFGSDCVVVGILRLGGVCIGVASGPSSKLIGVSFGLVCVVCSAMS